MAYQPLYLSIFHSFNYFFHYISSFFVHDEDNQMNYWKQIQDSEIYVCLLFLFFPFSISHSNVINMEILVKDFLGTTWPRILKVGTNIRYDKLYCV